MMSNRSLTTLLILAGIVLLPACRETSHTAVPTSEPVPATLFTAELQTIATYVTVPGSVQPRHQIVLSSQINGFVREVRVRSGAVVKQGQVLATLDAREAESQKEAAQAAVKEASAALEEARSAAAAAESMRTAAEANAELARSTLSRYQKLFEAKSVSPQELDEVRARSHAAEADLQAKTTMVTAARDRLRQIEARIDQAQAQVKRSDVVLDWTVVKAPAAARVSERRVDPGTAIFPGSPLFVLETTGNQQVIADIPTAQSTLLSLGLGVQIQSDGSAGSITEGKVSEVVPVSDPQTHTVRFKVDLLEEARTTPGRYVEVLVPTGERSALLLPRAAVRTTGQLTGVFIADEKSIARFRLVKMVDHGADTVEILSGIEPGARIVASPAPNVSDGKLLEIR